ncbi:MAG: hypothetical protein L5655_03970 [Thermosediminibacteraceae bacterium]|nr:hypothetical protein [Thermosediminibacteraceae bacterium]
MACSSSGGAEHRRREGAAIMKINATLVKILLALMALVLAGGANFRMA